MPFSNGLTTAEIGTIFAEETTAAGGSVSDTFDDGCRLFVRSILPWVEQVVPGDNVHGGVALRSTSGEVSVHPYVFRTVCRNGQIMAHSTQAQHVENLESLTSEEAAFAVSVAVKACCDEDVFVAVALAMRSARMAAIDELIEIIHPLAKLPEQMRLGVLKDIVGRFLEAGDRTRYGLLNAVTSAARDTRDPELRWRLEELGGDMLAIGTPNLTPDDAAAELTLA